MFVVVIGENSFLNLYKENLEKLNVDFSNVISPNELSPVFCDVYNNYLLKRAEVVLIFTPKDQFNFYISKLCKKIYKTKSIISLINNSNNKQVFKDIGVDKIIDPNFYINETLYKFLRKGAI